MAEHEVRRGPAFPTKGLTARECEVLRLVERGRTNPEIARRMGIGRPTVARHLSNAMDKLGAESRAHAVVIHGAVLATSTRREPPRDRGLDDEGRAILARLAIGRSLGAIARELHLSRRTADRRLADARAALGVERTTEAVAQALRLGWLG
ncbi:MAG TPA: LuxR C-terminal-related transcriptional regulator [Candidatus Limnocylindrales bacterium]|nr:LuxR C-terminal-related transcriptional regulator [Candidatus Limnocylindrales bacterium]